MNKRSIGKEYEDLACSFLKSQGFQILGRNYRVRLGEIDIIALDSSCICFIEVKYRKTDAYGYPSEAVNRKKQQKIISVSNCYLAEHGLTGAMVRYDVAEIMGNRIRLIKNSFGGN